ELLEQSGPLLSDFKCLKYITFMAADNPAPPAASGDGAEDDSGLSGEEDEAHIAKIWHRACPSLKTIILPKGKVWFQQNTMDISSILPPGSNNAAQTNISPNAENNAAETQTDAQIQGQAQWAHL
ncbi:hypothetical protein CPB84DRAFT_1748140, partial [Gymnopilus junonius]